MCRFIESICILNGNVRNPERHQERMSQTLSEFFDGSAEINLVEILNQIQIPQSGKYKLRIVYNKEVEKIELLPYSIKKINSFKLVEGNEIKYNFKFENRQIFENLKDEIEEDEIIILQNNRVTDTSYSNLVFHDGENWITPKSFLLNGTIRKFLLENGQIFEKEIQKEDLKEFWGFKMINSMMDLKESPFYPVNFIK